MGAQMTSLTDIQVLHPRPGAVVVEVLGEHDLATKTETWELLSSLVDANELVVVDVTEAQFIDSSFINNLINADSAARARGSQFTLQLGTARIVRSAFEHSGILMVLDHASTREEALDSL
jgi:anti-anti-sigma factor